MCPLTWEREGGYALARWRYSSTIVQQSGCSPVNSAGLNRLPSTGGEGNGREWKREEVGKKEEVWGGGRGGVGGRVIEGKRVWQSKW